MHLSTLLAATAATLTYASSLQPFVLPLFVRTPYLSTWLGNARDPPWEHWPIFWTGQEVGFSVLASVPGSNAVYPLLGRPHDSLPKSGQNYIVEYPTYLGATFDASTTNLTYEITGPSDEPLKVVLSFLSPITPTSTFRQSIPASYLTVEVSGDFDINVYLDINGLWTSSDRGNTIEWAFSHESKQGLKAFKAQRAVEQIFTENQDRAEWGSIHFIGPADVQYEAGTSGLVRQRFARSGTLQNVIDGNFRSIMDEEPVFAFSKSFKLKSASAARRVASESVLFTVAHLQERVIQYASADGMKHMKPFWSTQYKSAEDLLTFHYHDFNVASKLASNYSSQLESDALMSGSEDYKDILALSARQVLGACSFSGTPDNPLIFFKEISSDGNMNTVDVIFPAFPFFLYTNPRWLAYVMEPLIEHQLSGQYPNDYSMHDIGGSFPNATGHPDGNDEYMPVEECGNMLIMGLALVNALKYNQQPASIWSTMGDINTLDLSSDGLALHIDADGMDDAVGGPIEAKGYRQARKWVQKSYKLWKQWTGYLARETLIPTNQLSTDDIAGWLANQTNLALKGILGIRAMSEMAHLVGDSDHAYHLLNISERYVKRWHDEFALSRDGTHAKLAYNWYGSWTMLYNLFADSLLCFHLPASSLEGRGLGNGQKPLRESVSKGSKTAFVPEDVYKLQSDWYHNVRQKYGIPLDSRHLYTKSDWEFFSVAVASKKVRAEVIDSIALWVNETTTDKPLTDLYDTEDTGYPGIEFKARPVVGGYFAYMTLERACEGRAVAGLDFLNEDDTPSRWIEEFSERDL